MKSLSKIFIFFILTTLLVSSCKKPEAKDGIISRFCAQEGYISSFSTDKLSSSLMAISTGAIDIMCGAVLWDITKEGFYDNLIKEKRYTIILDGLKTTLVISVFSILFGTIIGGILCFFKMSKKGALVSFAQVVIGTIKGIPMLVLLMLMFYVVFAGSRLSAVSIAIVTFSLIFGAGVSEIFRSAIQSIDKGQREAGEALGFTKFQTFYYIIAPQAISRSMKLYKGEVISLVQSTSIVGYIAVLDLTKASDIVRSRTFDAFFPLIIISVIYFLISYLLTSALTLIDRKNERNNKC